MWSSCCSLGSRTVAPRPCWHHPGCGGMLGLGSGSSLPPPDVPELLWDVSLWASALPSPLLKDHMQKGFSAAPGARALVCDSCAMNWAAQFSSCAGISRGISWWTTWGVAAFSSCARVLCLGCLLDSQREAKFISCCSAGAGVCSAALPPEHQARLAGSPALAALPTLLPLPASCWSQRLQASPAPPSSCTWHHSGAGQDVISTCMTERRERDLQRLPGSPQPTPARPYLCAAGMKC